MTLPRAKMTHIVMDRASYFRYFNYMSGDSFDPKQAALDRVESLRNWRSTTAWPYPSFATYDQFDDFAAVIAGRKKAAIISGEALTFNNEPEFKALAALARERNLFLKVVYRQIKFSGRRIHQECQIVATSEEAVAGLKAALEKGVPRSHKEQMKIHREYGKWLDIDPGVVAAFIAEKENNHHPLERARKIFRNVRNSVRQRLHLNCVDLKSFASGSGHKENRDQKPPITPE
jgi:hypothetical protein